MIASLVTAQYNEAELPTTAVVFLGKPGSNLGYPGCNGARAEKKVNGINYDISMQRAWLLTLVLLKIDLTVCNKMDLYAHRTKNSNACISHLNLSKAFVKRLLKPNEQIHFSVFNHLYLLFSFRYLLKLSNRVW